MTQEEIHYNKRCAKFLGWDYSEERDRWNEDMLHQYSFVESIELKFHSDWNWIMEVVEAIEKIFHIQGVEINGKWCCIKTNTFHEYRGVNKKEAVVQAINKFLIWYEQNKTI